MVKSLSAGVSCPTFFLACREGLGKRRNISVGRDGLIHALSRRDAPEVCKSFRTSRKERAQGMPDARCTRGLVCKIARRVRTRAYRAAEAIRHSPRNGSTAYAVISP